MMYLIAFLVSFVLAYVTNPTRKPVVFAVFVLAFTFQYSIAIASFLLTYDNSYIAAAWEYRLMAVGLVGLAFAAGSLAILLLRPRLPSAENPRPTFSQINGIILVLAVIGLVLLMQMTDFVNYGSRLTSRSGRGFVFLFGFLAFAAALNFARFAPRKRPRYSWLLLVVAVVFFTVAGYRSFVMFCLLAAAFSYFGFSLVASRARFALFAGALTIIAVPVNFVTGAIRSLASSQQGDLSTHSVLDLARSLGEQQTVPMANTHLDILAFHLESASFDEKAFGTASTFFASLTNLLPRALFPDKSETTGVVLARQIFPEWFYSGEHTSSVTVGLIFEMIFNFGIPAGLLFFAVFIAVACLLFKTAMRIPRYGNYFAPLLAWCFFFNVFFDDLGGIVNKTALIIIGSAVVVAVDQLRPRGVKRHAIVLVDPVTRRNRG